MMLSVTEIKERIMVMMSRVEVGDAVRGVKFREGVYKNLGFDEVMEEYIGVLGTVTQIDNAGYVEVEFEEESYWYPMELLRKVGLNGN